MKTKWHEEGPGNQSAMRIMCMIALIMGSFMGWFALATKQIDVNVIGLISLFIVAAFAPKAVQKFAETKGILK